MYPDRGIIIIIPAGHGAIHYDLMINTGKIDLEDAADMIMDYIEKVQSE